MSRIHNNSINPIYVKTNYELNINAINAQLANNVSGAFKLRLAMFFVNTIRQDVPEGGDFI